AGHMSYETALLVLLLTPEAYLPLRAVGAQFHASMEGVAAAGRACDILETEPAPGVTGGTRGSEPASGVTGGTRGSESASGVTGGAGEAQAGRPGVAAARGRPGPRAAIRPDLHSVPLTLNAICLTYPHRDAPALDGVSLEICPGERITVTGPSGAGKSSLLALLLRFVAPTSGSIEAGGIKLPEIDADAWRRQIAWVPQRPHLFAGTVAANIALGQPDASAAAIARAAQAAGAAEFIEALPEGYDTPLGDRAGRLSAGQRQRIALARAFLRDAPLLLLDEPAAHLDPVTGRRVLDTVETMLAGRTVVLVTHGPSWSGRAGRVIALDHGRIVAETTSGPAPAVAGLS
ncbi:MAG TPA: ATP-binding cassette domain-containing protein, partial [Streptosporangiaceae bacterium]